MIGGRRLRISIPSSYAHFKTWLSNNDKELFDFLERYIDVAGDWWNDFERSLSEIDVPKLIRDTLLENRPVEIIAADLKYIDENNLKGIQPQIDVVARMLNGLRATLKKKA